MRLPAAAASTALALLAGCDTAVVLFPSDRAPERQAEPWGGLPPRTGPLLPPRSGLDGGADLDGGEADDRAVREGGGEGFPGPTVDPSPGPAGCEAVTTQSAWCATLRDDAAPGSTVLFVGLDDGASCAPQVATVAAAPVGVSSLALHGGHLFWCDATGVVQHVDLATGTASSTAAPALGCAGLTSLGDAIALLPQGLGRELSRFVDPGELLAGGRGVALPVRPWASRIAADLAVLYASWHETDTVQRWTHAGEPLPPLTLDWSGWIHGLDSAPGERIVIVDEQRDLRVFDRVTGAEVALLPQTGTLAGLACFPDPFEPLLPE